MTTWLRVAARIVTLAGAAGCAGPARTPSYVATVLPAAYILREMVGDSADVATLVPPGASPHTYEPRPSDVRAAQGAIALFFVSPTLDGWAARLPAPRHYELLSILPVTSRRAFSEDDGSTPPERGAARVAVDPHFWTDPRTVGALLPALADTLCALDAGRCALYRANAARFADTLRALDAELAAELAPLRGRSVALFHPSFQYMLARYGIGVAVVVEPFPGKEPTAKDIESMARTIRLTGVDVILTEPQLPRRPATVIAEEAHVRLAELDPLGGAPGRDTYPALLRYNASALARSIQR
jgi:ABC-type Zn uptake system ZnuABC Zn-binding protein ZnuA